MFDNHTTAEELLAALVTSIEELGTEKTSEIILPINKDHPNSVERAVLTIDPIRELAIINDKLRLKDEEFYEKIYDGSKEKLLGENEDLFL